MQSALQGEAAFDIMYKYAAGETIAPMIINPDNFYDSATPSGGIPSSWDFVPAICVAVCNVVAGLQRRPLQTNALEF